jgi:iron complex outermembrane receptor protein
MELEFQAKLIKSLDIKLSYNFGDFKFVDYDLDGESLSGNRLPGIPLRSGFAQIKYSNQGWHVEYAHRMFSEIFVDNQNTLSAPGFNVGNFRFSKTLIFQGRRVVPYIGINNIFDTNYYDNIRINAFGGRYFETAPGRNYYFGLKFDFLDYKEDSQKNG